METLVHVTTSLDTPTATEVYAVLAKHQRLEDWDRREIIWNLQAWASRFIVEFNLDIKEVVLCVDQLPRTQYGRFRYGHNGFGLRGEIAINSRYVSDQRGWWDVLGTLLHELLHAWQQEHGTPSGGNHHNAEFREKARQLGLLVDRHGVQGYAASGLFRDLMQSSGVEMPEGEIVAKPRQVAGSSKLKRWSCGCTNVWVGTRILEAECLKCGKLFTRGGSEEPETIPGNALVKGSSAD